MPEPVVIYALDACAKISYLDNEARTGVVEAAMIEPANQGLAH